MRIHFVPVLAVLALLLLPGAFAQGPGSGAYARRVDTCSERCLPTDPDVNQGPLPRTGNESFTMILYPHVEDLGSTWMNPQLVSPDEPPLEAGFSMVTLNTETGTPADQHFRNNRFTWRVTPSFSYETDDGTFMSFFWSGLTGDVHFAGDTIWLYLYLAVSHAPGQEDGALPAPANVADALAGLGVHARITTSLSSYDPTSVLLAEGDTSEGEIAGIVPGPDRLNLVSLDGGLVVWEVGVPLRIFSPIAPGSYTPSAEGARVGDLVATIELYQVKDKGGPDDGRTTEIATWDWRFVSGWHGEQQFTPRLVFGVQEPLRTKHWELEFRNGDLYIRWSIQASFGPVDTRRPSLNISIAGPSPVDATLAKLIVSNYGDGYDRPLGQVNTSWRFDYGAARLADGDYTINVSILNQAGTYRLQQSIPLRVEEGLPWDYESPAGITVEIPGRRDLLSAYEAPGPGFAVPMAALLALGAWLLRRRDNNP